jgi:TolB protein
VTSPRDPVSFVRRPRVQPQIVFTRFGTRGRGTPEIWVVNASGTQTRLSNKSDQEPTWSPNGSKIAFSSSRDGGNLEIYAMNADGSGQINLTKNAATDQTPAWSPDGSKILFSTNRNRPAGEIWVMDANGANPTQLTDATSANFANNSPAWSPDGSKIAFVSDRDGPGGEIYVMDANGANPTRLTFNDGKPDASPVWSPDGSKIAFLSSRDVTDRAQECGR